MIDFLVSKLSSHRVGTETETHSHIGRPSLKCHSGCKRNEAVINCEITFFFNNIKTSRKNYYELFKHPIKDLMKGVGCYWFFPPHPFHTDYSLFVFYTLLIFTPYHFKSVTLQPLPFLTPVQKAWPFHVLFTVRRRGKRAVSAVSVLPYSWRRWTSLLCRKQRARWSAPSSFVP